MSQADLGKLLTDDTRRRVTCARVAAAQWASAEVIAGFEVISEGLLIASRGLLYAARLSGPVPEVPAQAAGHEPRRYESPHRTLHYLAVAPQLFEPIAGQASVIPLRRGEVAVVDRRLGYDLEFPWPLDAALRRMLDGHELLRVDPPVA